VGGHARRRDDHLDARRLSALGERAGVLRRPMRREHPNRRLDPELTKLLDATLHHAKIAVGTHDYRNEGLFSGYHLSFPAGKIE
jgi:hypothetical protein